VPVPSRLVVITDLDGTLLDQHNYSYNASQPAVDRLLELKIPLILCSSKTRAEIQCLWDELGLRDPFIAENGGALWIPAKYFPVSSGAAGPDGWTVIELGQKVASLRQALVDAAVDCQARVRSWGNMGLEEIAALTGLTLEQARRATQRLYDEPFVVEEGDAERLAARLTSTGLRVVKGDRFYHVMGKQDKGHAAKTILDLYRKTTPALRSIGVGNSANDLLLLANVDLPVLVRNPDGSWDEEVSRQIPGILKSTEVGPAGWREMIERVLADFAS
jgi:mannosyl-3-phosphoglycerate phosphatase family protein